MVERKEAVKWVVVVLYTVAVFVAPVQPNIYTGVCCIK
jgi:hypothetical protein